MARPIRPGEPIPPKVNATRQGLRKLDAWLLATARERGTEWQRTLIQGLDPKRLSPADRSILNDIIYDDPDGVIL